MARLLSDFHCVVCGQKITIGRADECRESSLPGCCKSHEQATVMDIFECLPSWNDHFFGGWRKSPGDEYWTDERSGLANDGNLYFTEVLPDARPDVH